MLVGPDNKEIVAPPEKGAPTWVDRLAHLPASPYILAGLLIFNTYAAAKSEIEYWWLQPMREAAAVKQEEIREGRHFPPRARLIFEGSTCVLRNEDFRSIVEATIVWKTYYVDLGKKAVPVASWGQHFGPATESREVKPRELLRTPTNTEVRDQACKDHLRTIICPSGHCPITIIECEAQFARESDRQPYRLSEYGYLDEACTSHALGEAHDAGAPGGWKDPRVGAAFALVQASARSPIKKLALELMDQMDKVPEPVHR